MNRKGMAFVVLLFLLLFGATEYRLGMIEDRVMDAEKVCYAAADASALTLRTLKSLIDYKKIK